MSSEALTRRYKVGQSWPPLVARIVDADEQPVDLTGATATFLMRPTDGPADTYTLDEPAEILSPPGDGRVRYQWAPTDLDTAGDYLAWFKVIIPPDGAVGVLPYDQDDAGASAAIDIRVEPT
jgi:hypothetical protein